MFDNLVTTATLGGKVMQSLDLLAQEDQFNISHGSDEGQMVAHQKILSYDYEQDDTNL